MIPYLQSFNLEKWMEENKGSWEGRGARPPLGKSLRRVLVETDAGPVTVLLGSIQKPSDLFRSDRKEFLQKDPHPEDYGHRVVGIAHPFSFEVSQVDDIGVRIDEKTDSEKGLR